MIQDAVEKYLDCGNPMCGFARIRCSDCGEARLLMFSFKIRGFYPSRGGRMSVISSFEELKTIDRIIRHLGLTFEAERPPPPRVFQKDLLIAAEEKGEYF